VLDQDRHEVADRRPVELLVVLLDQLVDALARHLRVALGEPLGGVLDGEILFAGVLAAVVDRHGAIMHPPG
jgi:hypothetical protein